MILISLSIYKCEFSCRFGATALPSDLLHSHKPNLHLNSCIDTVTSEPALYKLLSFLVPNLVSIFWHFRRLSNESVQIHASA
jgi:hypothetical protein